ncbi:MAG: hypothetical protein OES90_06730, partial [Xanthomonadales bacterium]|nr:hypothetical protein [Xanthomonadales bacterium]
NHGSEPYLMPWCAAARTRWFARFVRVLCAEVHGNDATIGGNMWRMSENSLFTELRKRKVVQVAAIYGAVAWGVTEILVTVVEQLFLPQWVSTLAVIGFVVGFPVAMFLAWIFDITPEGIQRVSLSSRRGKAGIAGSMLLLIAGTAGLFLLIKPAMQGGEAGDAPEAILANSVAVLPFENASRDPEDVYLSEGLSDELRDQLSRVPGLRIAARSSSIAVREKEADALTMSARLGVALLVEGSLRRRGNNLRISVQLIDGKTGLALWSERFDRGPQELLTVQQTIAEQISMHVLPDITELAVTPATRDATANELLLLARYYEQQVRAQPEVDVDKLIEAIRLYREATEADPDSALAHSRLAAALLYLGDMEGAEAPIFRALSLDPELSEVQDTLGLFYWARGLPEAGTAFERAVELNPNNADALSNYAFWWWFEINNDGVAQLYQRALELDPLSLSRYGALGEYFGKEGRTEETYKVIQRVKELFDDTAAYRLIGWLYELTGDTDLAIAWNLKARNLEPDNPLHALQLAELYAEIGDFETALKFEPEPGVGLLFKMRRYEELIDTAEFLMIEEPEDMVLRYLLAFAYNATGQFESAIYVLSTTGLPDSVLKGWRVGADFEGFMTLVNALNAVGETATAIELSEWAEKRGHTNSTDWWVNTYRACSLVILGRDEQALQHLEAIRESPRPAWDPVIRDSTCFQRFKDNPVYQETLRQMDQRRADLRKKLPATLAQFQFEP